METFYQIIALLGAGLIVWYLYRMVKGNPELFSRENITKSFSSMGILALLLIGFIGLLVLFLNYA